MEDLVDLHLCHLSEHWFVAHNKLFSRQFTVFVDIKLPEEGLSLLAFVSG
jgi:hypothetical protein